MTELTFGQVIQIVRRWWWLLVIGPLAGGALAFALTSSTPPRYEAQTVLLVDRSNFGAEDRSANIYNDILAAERLTQTYGQLVTTTVVLSETLDRLGAEAAAMSVDDLVDAVTVTTVEDTQLIRVEVTDSDPDRAALIANTLAAVFTEQAVSMRPELPVENSLALQASIDDIVSQMDETESQISDLEARPDAGSPEVQAQIRELRTQLGEYQSLHAELVEIQQRMTITEAASGVSVIVVDPAVTPNRPVANNQSFSIFLGVLAGLIVTGGVVFVLSYLDNTVKTAEDVQWITGRSAIGLIPTFDAPERLEALTDLRSRPAETFRALRTNLQFATVGKVVRSLVATSANPGEGKTTTLLYLGMVLAQGGQRVILVDADLRRPALHRIAGLPNDRGLTNLLLNDSQTNIDSYLQWTDLPTLKVLPTGPLPPNPADPLNSRRMQDIIHQLELMADIVLIDTASLRFPDPLIIAGMVSGSLVIVSAGETRSNDLSAAIAALEQTGTPIIGSILNRARVNRDELDLEYGEVADASLASDALPPVAIGEQPERRRRFALFGS